MTESCTGLLIRAGIAVVMMGLPGLAHAQSPEQIPCEVLTPEALGRIGSLDQYVGEWRRDSESRVRKRIEECHPNDPAFVRSTIAPLTQYARKKRDERAQANLRVLREEAQREQERARQDYERRRRQAQEEQAAQREVREREEIERRQRRDAEAEANLRALRQEAERERDRAGQDRERRRQQAQEQAAQREVREREETERRQRREAEQEAQQKALIDRANAIALRQQQEFRERQRRQQEEQERHREQAEREEAEDPDGSKRRRAADQRALNEQLEAIARGPMPAFCKVAISDALRWGSEFSSAVGSVLMLRRAGSSDACRHAKRLASESRQHHEDILSCHRNSGGVDSPFSPMILAVATQFNTIRVGADELVREMQCSWW